MNTQNKNNGPQKYVSKFSNGSCLIAASSRTCPSLKKKE